MTHEDRIEELRVILKGQEALRAERLRAERELRSEVERLAAEVSLLEGVDEVLAQVSGRVLGQSTAKIDELLTHGLRTVFEDQDLQFSTDVEKFRGRTSVKFRLTCAGVEAPIMDAYGGGVLAVAAVLLRVVVVMVLGLRRVLLLDESLSMVAKEYVPGTSRLLRKLASELGFAVLVVTHQDLLAEHADAHYRAVGLPGKSCAFRRVTS